MFKRSGNNALVTTAITLMAIIGPCACAAQTYDVAAFYWPSLHYDERWAEFFVDGSQGEWESIRNCKPKWEGHWQPRVPAWGYLMDNDPAAMEKKIKAATRHGVNVMLFDWYWFENKPFLESALNDGFLKAKNVDKMKFYLMWANHDAKTAWDRRRSHKMEVIWPGSVDLPTFKTVVARVIRKYFSHRCYYKIDGKPVFAIYDMNNLIKGLGGIQQTVAALDYFRSEVRKAGFPGLHIQMIYWGKVPKIDDSGFASAKGTTANTVKIFKIDSLTNYQFAHLARPVGDYIPWADKATANWPKWSRDFDAPYFPHVSIGWDNNARFKEIRGAITENVNPETFKTYLLKAKAYVDAHPDQAKLITINAWNEWVEGSYLEPDERFGMGYLEAVRDVFVSPSTVTIASAQPREELLATLLKRFPQADTNKDGVLTMQEARAFQSKRQNKRKVVDIPPTHADVSYGPHSNHVLDLWLTPSDTPTPLLVFIHGGGFRGGDKRQFDSSLIENMHKEGISVASINYRLTKAGLLAEGENRYPAPMHDGARALQFLRYHASRYNLDKTRFAATGGSAGGCMLMWLGFHDDLALPDHKDPVLRESSRLQVLAPRGGQSCVHGPTLLKWFGVESLNLSKQKGVVQSSSDVKQPTAEQLALGLDASPITHLTPDDPPIYLLYNSANDPVNEETPWGTWVHHPIFGIKLKEAMEVYLGMECHLEYKDGPPVTAYESQQDFIIKKLKSLPRDAIKGNPQVDADGDSVLTEEEEAKWKTTGFKQSNTMGAGQAAISKSGAFRVFVLMGQSNMQGTGRAKELKAPYNEKHDRIRIWANGRWEYFVPSQRFGPGVSLAHQLADFWPDDTIGIIKVAVGGTGICGFEKNWSFERAARTFDGNKGSMYKDLMNAVASAKNISQPEFSGFVWKQGAADGTKKDLADEYYDTFKQLVSDLRTDLDAPDLPVFILSYMNDKDLLKRVLPLMNEEELLEAKGSAGKGPLSDQELLKRVLSYMYDKDLPKARKLVRRSPYIGTVIMAHNRAGRDIPNVTTVHHGKLPVLEDGVHFNAEGQIKLGRITASAVEEFYKAKE